MIIIIIPWWYKLQFSKMAINYLRWDIKKLRNWYKENLCFVIDLFRFECTKLVRLHKLQRSMQWLLKTHFATNKRLRVSHSLYRKWKHLTTFIKVTLLMSMIFSLLIMIILQCLLNMLMTWMFSIVMIIRQIFVKG